jgi:hypothetical protein
VVTWVVVAGLTAVALLLRLPHLGESLFGDELFAYVEVHGHGLRDVVTNVSRGEENSPPLYFVLAWISIKLGDPTALIRLPSLVCGTALVPVVFLLGSRIRDNATGLVAATLTALSPFAVYFSTEARPYATLMLLLATSTLALLLALDTRRAAWWALYVASGAGALLTHYTALPVIVFQAAWAFWTCRDRARELVAAHSAMAAVALLWVPLLIRQRGEAQDLGITGSIFPLTLDSFARSTAQLVPGYERFELEQLPGSLALWLFLGAVAVALGALLLRRPMPMGRARPGPRLVLALGLALATPVCVLVYSLVGPDLYNTRRLLASFPGVVILLGALLTTIPRPVAIVTTSLVVVSLAIGLERSLDPDRARSPLKEAARFVDARAAPGDPVVEYVFLGVRGLFTRHLSLNFEEPHPLHRTGLVAAPPDLWSRVGSPRRLYVVEAWGDPPERNPLPPEAAARFRLAGTHVWRGAPPVAVLEFAPRRPGAAD